jgi:hypothetical protein
VPVRAACSLDRGFQIVDLGGVTGHRQNAFGGKCASG